MQRSLLSARGQEPKANRSHSHEAFLLILRLEVVCPVICRDKERRGEGKLAAPEDASVLPAGSAPSSRCSKQLFFHSVKLLAFTLRPENHGFGRPHLNSTRDIRSHQQGNTGWASSARERLWEECLEVLNTEMHGLSWGLAGKRWEEGAGQKSLSEAAASEFGGTFLAGIALLSSLPARRRNPCGLTGGNHRTGCPELQGGRHPLTRCRGLQEPKWPPRPRPRWEQLHGQRQDPTHGSRGRSTSSPRGAAALGTSAGSASREAGLSVQGTEQIGRNGTRREGTLASRGTGHY